MPGYIAVLDLSGCAHGWGYLPHGTCLSTPPKVFIDPTEKSWLVNVYKGKGDALACGSYRGINAQSASLRSLVAAESIWQQSMKPARDHKLFCVGFDCVYLL